MGVTSHQSPRSRHGRRWGLAALHPFTPQDPYSDSDARDLGGLPKRFAQNCLGDQFLSIHQHSSEFIYTIRSPTSICGPYDQGVVMYQTWSTQK